MQHVFSLDDKRLTVFAKNLHGSDEQMGDLAAVIDPLFQELAPFLSLNEQVLYIRDIKEYTIDQTYVAGNTYVPNEVQIAVPAWPADATELKACLAHELHHLARWQNAGYGKTLGQAIITEGLAVFYEEQNSGWVPPWAKAGIQTKAYAAAKAEWNSKNYNHSNWFHKGRYGKWVGYTIGYRLVKEVIFLVSSFELESSVKNEFDQDGHITAFLSNASI